MRSASAWSGSSFVVLVSTSGTATSLVDEPPVLTRRERDVSGCVVSATPRRGPVHRACVDTRDRDRTGRFGCGGEAAPGQPVREVRHPRRRAASGPAGQRRAVHRRRQPGRSPPRGSDMSEVTPTLLHGRYEVVAVVGRGGEGTLVRAVDRRHGRDVALKLRRVPGRSPRRRTPAGRVADAAVPAPPPRLAVGERRLLRRRPPRVGDGLGRRCRSVGGVEPNMAGRGCHRQRCCDGWRRSPRR